MSALDLEACEAQLSVLRSALEADGLPHADEALTRLFVLLYPDDGDKDAARAYVAAADLVSLLKQLLVRATGEQGLLHRQAGWDVVDNAAGILDNSLGRAEAREPGILTALLDEDGLAVLLRVLQACLAFEGRWPDRSSAYESLCLVVGRVCANGGPLPANFDAEARLRLLAALEPLLWPGAQPYALKSYVRAPAAFLLSALLKHVVVPPDLRDKLLRALRRLFRSAIAATPLEQYNLLRDIFFSAGCLLGDDEMLGLSETMAATRRRLLMDPTDQ